MGNSVDTGINWFEVDMPDVVEAKRCSLTAVNAQTTRTPQPGHSNGYAYSINTANYSTFAADLQGRSGYTLHVPVVLLMYKKAVCFVSHVEAKV